MSPVRSALRRILLALAFLAAAGAARAQLMVSVRESDDVLVKIDTATLAFTPIGALGVSFEFGDLTWNPNSSTLYMIGGRGNNNLYTVNLATGLATLIGTHGINDLFGLAFDPSTNRLFASQFSGGSGIYTLDIDTGAATFLANSSGGLGGLAYDATHDVLLGINDGSGQIYSINRTTGATTLVASPGGNNDSGLTYDPTRDRLWNIDWSGNLYAINVGSGYTRTTVLSGLGPYDGLAMTSIPEPSSYALLAVGGLLLVRRLRRRR